MNSRVFSIVFLSVYLVFGSAVLGLGAWVEPFEGDLTRFGGMAENRFGWKQAQAAFPENLTRYHTKADGHYQGEQDIVVFGDSFSQMGTAGGRTFGWQNFLVAATGLTVFTYNLGVVDIRDWLSRQAPEEMPKYIIFQRIERRLSEAKSANTDCELNFEQTQLGAPQSMSAADASHWYTRPSKQGLELETAIHWLRKNVRQDSDVLTFKLQQPGLFSSPNDGTLLIYKNDFLVDEKRRRDADIAGLSCYLEELRQLAESNGKTKFILMVAPDKYTVYRNFTSEDNKEKSLFVLLEEAGVPLLRLDLMFEAKAKDDIQDLYLPNDTHWGSEGNRLFASIVARLLDTTEGERFSAIDDSSD